MYLSNDIIFNIQSFINTTKLYLNFRSLNRFNYNKMKIVKKFKNNKINKIIHLNTNNINIYNNKNKLIESYDFKNFGKTVYRKYNYGELKERIIYKSPFNVNYLKKENGIIITKKFNIKKDKNIKIGKYPMKNGCLIS